MEDFTVNPLNYDHIFVAGQTTSGYMALHKSTNGGLSWTTHQVSLSSGNAYAAAVDPGNDQIIYIGGYKSGSSSAVFKSQNGGSSWAEITGGVTGEVRALAVDAGLSHRIYAGTSSGLFKSIDGGGSWSKKTAWNVRSIKINPNNRAEIYAGGGSGVYRSLDYGETWSEFKNGLTITQVNCLDMDAAGTILFAGTAGGGVYKNSQAGYFVLTIQATAGGTTNPIPGNYNHPSGASVNVTAVPSFGYAFAGWSGDATGTANPVAMVMNSNKSITANFVELIYAPLNFAGIKKMNRSVLMAQYINVLTWQANPANKSVAKYRVYLVEAGSRSLLAEVGPNVFEYRHIKVDKAKAYVYAVAAVSGTGREGDFAQITVQ
jgi:uncharacterized repeat protein (TIGR02543 family)